MLRVVSAQQFPAEPHCKQWGLVLELVCRNAGFPAVHNQDETFHLARFWGRCLNISFVEF